MVEKCENRKNSLAETIEVTSMKFSQWFHFMMQIFKINEWSL